ncbi:MAG: hypothetical protein VW397_08525, partial [Candidatus Margulisiibacteriota bacterium]
NTVEVTYLSGKKVDMSRADFLKKYSQLPNIGNTQFNLLIAVVNRQEPLYTLLKELYNAKEITYNENGLTITSNDASVATKHITDISKIFDDFERLPEGTAQKIIKFILPTARIENILSQQDQSLQKNEQQLILGIEHVNKNGVSLTRLGVSDFEVYFTKENGHYSIYLKGGSYSLDKPFRTGLTTDEFINLCENTFETGEKAINDEKEKSVTDLLTEYNLPNHTQDEADPNKRIIDQILPLMMHLDTTRIAGHKSGKREYERALMIFNAKEIKVNGDIVTITSSVSDGIETLTLTDFKNKIISYYFDENGAEQTPATKLRQLLRRDIPNEEMKDLEAYFNTIMDKGITYNHLDKDVLDRLCKKYEEIELRFPYKFILHYYEGKHELQTPCNEFLEQIESTKMSDLSIKGHQPRITDSMANVRGVENEKGEIIRYDQKESGTHSPTCELEQDQNGGLTFKRDGKAQGILDVAKQFHHKNFLNVKKAYLDQINRDLSEKKTSYNSKQKIKKVRRSSGRGSGYSVYTGGGGGGGGGIIGGGGNTLTNFGNIFF